MSNRIPLEGIDYTSKDYMAYKSLMLEQLTLKMPEYTDHSETDAGIVLLELLAMGLDITSYYNDIVAGETFFVTAVQRRNVLKWCKLLGYVPKSATPSQFKQVFILSRISDTDYLVPKGTTIHTVAAAAENSVYFETAADFYIPAGNLGDEKDTEGNYLFLADLIQGQTIKEEAIGTSNGTKSQSFSLMYTPVISGSVQVFVNEGTGFREWTYVSTFIDSGSTDTVFTVEIDEQDVAQVVFGDGVFGKIPTPFPNGLFSTYRIGGGTQGNVSANTITELETPAALIYETYNPYLAYELGIDRESLEDIKRNALASFKTPWGALTLKDFSEVVKANFPEILYASAYRSAENQDDLNIYVMPLDSSESADDVRDDILTFFNENEGGRKIVGAAVITILDYIPQSLIFNMLIVVRDGYKQSSVVTAIEDYLSLYFARGTRNFQEELNLTELNGLVETNVAGVKAIQLTIDSGVPDTTELVVYPNEGSIFVYGGKNTVTITGGIAD